MPLALKFPEEIKACLDSLSELSGLISSLPEGAYAKAVEALGGSIGGHTRHILDHYQSFRESVSSVSIHFEKRQRERQLEQDASLALEKIASLQAWLQEGCGERILERSIASRVSLDGEVENFIEISSSLRRELVYVVLHGVHHMALIAVAVRLQGLALPVNFGKAPATRVFEAKQAKKGVKR